MIKWLGSSLVICSTAFSFQNYPSFFFFFNTLLQKCPFPRSRTAQVSASLPLPSAHSFKTFKSLISLNSPYGSSLLSIVSSLEWYSYSYSYSYNNAYISSCKCKINHPHFIQRLYDNVEIRIWDMVFYSWNRTIRSLKSHSETGNS